MSYRHYTDTFPYLIITLFMPTFTKNILSSSTDGRAILVAATATAGTLIHT